MRFIHLDMFLLMGILLIACTRKAKVYGHAREGEQLTIMEKKTVLLNIRVEGVKDNVGLCILSEELSLPLRDSVAIAFRLDSGGHILLDTLFVLLRSNKEPVIWVDTAGRPIYRWTAAVGDGSKGIKM